MVTIDQAYRDTARGELADIARRLERDAARIREILASTRVVAPMDIDPAGRIAAARHLDTVRPGPNHPTLFDGRGQICVATFGCTTVATHTIQESYGPVYVCADHFTEWAAARPI